MSPMRRRQRRRQNAQEALVRSGQRHGHTVEEVALAMGIPVTEVAELEARAMAKLRANPDAEALFAALVGDDNGET